MPSACVHDEQEVAHKHMGETLDSATAVEKEVARADDGSTCPGCRMHGQARRHAALAAAKRGRVALGPRRSASARVAATCGKQVTLRSRFCTNYSQNEPAVS